MSRMRGILLEVAGCAVGFTSTEIALASHPATWATSFVEAIVAVPPSQSMAIDPFNGEFQSGGTDLKLTQAASILTARSSSPSTTLTANISKTALAMTVASTTTLPAAGTVWIGGEAITYTGGGGGGTSLTGLTRGALGTLAAAHSTTIGVAGEANRVFGFNPAILGRVARISWYDTEISAPPAILRFYGTIDDIQFGGDGFTLRLISNAKQFIDAEAMSSPFVSGSFLGAFFKGQTDPFKDLPARANNNKGGLNAILVSLDDEGRAFDGTSAGSLLGYYKMGEEVFGYVGSMSTHPAISSVTYVTLGSSSTLGLWFDTDGGFLAGDDIRWLDSGAYLYAKVIKVERNTPSTSPSTTSNYRVYHTGQVNPAAGVAVETPGKQKLSPLFRAQAGSTEGDHKIGDEVKEVRRIFGNHVEVVLALMLSTDSTGGATIYDTLPLGWGAAVDPSWVDVAAFETLIPLAEAREFIFEGPVSIRTQLALLARLTGARIYVNTQGILTASLERALYPDTSTSASITTDDLSLIDIPSWHPQMANVYNSWAMRGNAPGGSDFKDEAIFEEAISVARYGRRPLPDLEDRYIRLTTSAVRLEVLAYSTLRRWSRPCPILDLTVLIDEAVTPYEPGQLVAVTIPHLPDLTGGEGLTGQTFEVLEWAPDDASGVASVRLALMPPQGNTRLISPAAEFAGVDLGTRVMTLAATADSHLSNPLGKTGIDPVMPRAGIEDGQYFEVGLTVLIQDRSTPANTHSTTLSAIDYPANTVTLAALPGWTVAAGDVMRLDAYATTKAYKSEFVDHYAFLATTSTRLLGSDAGHVWGI